MNLGCHLQDFSKNRNPLFCIFDLFKVNLWALRSFERVEASGDGVVTRRQPAARVRRNLTGAMARRN